MNFLLDFIKLIPVSLQVAIASMVIGGAAVYGAESRYMTVSDFTKSYVLDLKKSIREIMRTLDDEMLTDLEREWLEIELEELIDELCYEAPEDRLCKDYERID
jgi:hypothetical protein